MYVCVYIYIHIHLFVYTHMCRLIRVASHSETDLGFVHAVAQCRDAPRNNHDHHNTERAKKRLKAAGKNPRDLLQWPSRHLSYLDSIFFKKLPGAACGALGMSERGSGAVCGLRLQAWSADEAAGLIGRSGSARTSRCRYCG